MQAEQQHLTAEQAEHLRSRLVSAEEKTRWERHLAGCRQCLDLVYGGTNAQLASDRLEQAFLAPDGQAFHLSRQELQRYSIGVMDEADREIFESHLEGCAPCREQAEALAGVQRRAPMPKAVAVEPPSVWPHLWQRPRIALAVCVATVVVAGCSFLGWELWHRRSAGPEQAGHSAPAGAPVVLRLRDGNTEVTLDKEDKLAGLESYDPAARNAVQEVMVKGVISKPQILTDLSRPAIKLMGDSGNLQALTLISPVDTVVAADQPTLRWEPVRGASAYAAVIFDSQFRPVAKSNIQQKTEWVVTRPLLRDTTYFWQVIAMKGKRQTTVPAAPASWAAFKVLDSQTAERMNKARATAANSHLATGILYAEAGLREDAERELQLLVQENPESAVAAKLLSDVRSWKH